MVVGVGCVKVRNAKCEQYCWQQFFSMVDIITRHKKPNFSKNIAKQNGASHFLGPMEFS